MGGRWGFALSYTLDPVMGSKGPNIFFSESGHVAYEIASKNFDLSHILTSGVVFKAHVWKLYI